MKIVLPIIDYKEVDIDIDDLLLSLSLRFDNAYTSVQKDALYQDIQTVQKIKEGKSRTGLIHEFIDIVYEYCKEFYPEEYNKVFDITLPEEYSSNNLYHLEAIDKLVKIIKELIELQNAKEISN